MKREEAINILTAVTESDYTGTNGYVGSGKSLMDIVDWLKAMTPRGLVKVKGLEWRQNKYGDWECWDYKVQLGHATNRWYASHYQYSEWELEEVEHLTAASARAACQKHYEDSIFEQLISLTEAQ